MGKPNPLRDFIKAIKAVEKPMSLTIVSLGNPGKSFASTRHSAGHMLLHAIRQELAALGSATTHKIRSSTATTFHDHPDITFFESGSYMNESAKSIKHLLEWQRNNASGSGAVALTDSDYVHTMLVLHDDLDLELGEVKFKQGGQGKHGHNGLRSILDSRILDNAGSNYYSAKSFPRLRIGIGRPDDRDDVAQYVLHKFTHQEMAVFNDITVPSALDIITELLYSGVFKSFSESG